MKKHSYYFSLILIFLISSFSILTAQSNEEKSRFRQRIDSIVQNTMDRFDEQLGTYIFRDEPPADAEEQDDEIKISSHFGQSLYPSKGIHDITRNITPLLPWENIDDHVLFRYNRVEGLLLGLNFPQEYNWEDRNITLFGHGSYSFAGHRWLGGIGAAHQFGFNGRIFELGLEGHSLTDTKDQWLVDLAENNLAAILLRNDYRDYFEREGFSVWSGFYFRGNKSDAQIQIAYLTDNYGSLQCNTNWSVFGTGKTFRENPAVDDGRMKSVLASFKFHSTESRKIFTAGWSLNTSAEIAGKTFGGVFDFNRYLLDLRRYQPISRYDNLNLRFRAASATGSVPAQKILDLGGISSIPAFGYKEFAGNRLLLVNAEYLINGKLMDKVALFPSWLLRNLNLILFADAGYISTASSDASPFSGFKSIDSKSVRSDWGIGVGTRDAKFRLGFAWRTDKSDPPMVFLRLNRPF